MIEDIERFEIQVDLHVLPYWKKFTEASVRPEGLVDIEIGEWKEWYSVTTSEPIHRAGKGRAGERRAHDTNGRSGRLSRRHRRDLAELPVVDQEFCDRASVLGESWLNYRCYGQAMALIELRTAFICGVVTIESRAQRVEEESIGSTPLVGGIDRM